MSAPEFLNARGVPRDASQVSDEAIEKSAGRLPDDLIDFWKANGIGSYAGRNYWLCTSCILDGILQSIFADIPSIKAGDLAAFGYTSLGQIDLWHREGRHFTLSLDTALLMDMTSRTRTDPPPYDLEDLYRSAGLDVPENALELFEERRSAPEDIWMLLLAATGGDAYRYVTDDIGRMLIPQLRKALGDLRPGELYFRSSNSGANLASEYRRLPIEEAAALMPNAGLYSYAIDDGGRQTILEDVIHIRSLP